MRPGRAEQARWGEVRIEKREDGGINFGTSSIGEAHTRVRGTRLPPTP